MHEFRVLKIDLPSVEEFKKGLSPLIYSHLDWLKEESKRHNLTRVPEEDWQVRHVMDSLAPILAGWEIGDSFVDIGTGPGFPGVPLGLQKDQCRFALIESKKKVVHILNEFLDTHHIAPRGAAYGERIEDVARQPEHRGRYDRVVTRALSSLSVLIELGVPLLKVKGELWCWKSSVSELNDVGKTLKKLHVNVSKILEYSLPGESETRYILSFVKQKTTPSEYPRKCGVPQKRPLS